ncbi:hypothetical protein EHM82_01090, partial [bacterium]
LVFASNGDLYFTDQGQTGLHDPTGRVYRLSADGRLDCLLDTIPSPNGLVLNRSENVVFVAVTRANAIWIVPMTERGGVSKVGLFVQLPCPGPDGMALDEKGSIAVAHPGLGVVWLHVLAGLNLDILGFVGAVLLIGVVVNNGIVLIDYVNRLREEGHARTEALLLATERRFRPIMMTALTTICGMIPLTFGGTNRIGLSYTSFGFTLIGGMTTATLLTLLIVPVFYTFFDDAREAVGRAVRRGSYPRNRSRSSGVGNQQVSALPNQR